MNFGKKMLVGALGLAIVAGIGEYSLYKKFENTQHPFREMARWPSNEEYARLEDPALMEEYDKLREKPLEVVIGRVGEVRGLQGYTELPFSGARFTIKRDSINFIKLEDGRRFVYTGDFFAEKSDKVKLAILSSGELAEIQKFLDKVNHIKTENGSWFWLTRGYDDIIRDQRINEAFRSVPISKLVSLDGIIGRYQIVNEANKKWEN